MDAFQAFRRDRIRVIKDAGPRPRSPAAAIPSNIMTHVEDSGTGAGGDKATNETSATSITVPGGFMEFVIGGTGASKEFEK